MNAGRKHTASGRAINTPARSACAVAWADASARKEVQIRWHPAAMVAPDWPDMMTSCAKSSSPAWPFMWPHADCAGTPTPSSAATVSHSSLVWASAVRATAVVAPCTESPAAKHAAKSSTSPATASGSSGAAGLSLLISPPRTVGPSRGVLTVVSVALAGAKRAVCGGRPTRVARAIKMSGGMRPPSG